MDKQEERYDVVVVIETLIAFYSLEPLMDELLKRKKKLHLIYEEEVKKFAQEKYGNKVVHDDYAPLIKKYGRLNKIHFALLKFITKKSFSYQYNLLTNPTEENAGIISKLIYYFSFITPKVANTKVNKVLHGIFSLFNKLDLHSQKVLVASRFSYPVILCSKNFEVYTVVESWDHPVKVPVGYCSAKVFAWNKELKEDWEAYQGDKKVLVGYPFKLRDWFEKGLRSDMLSNINSSRKILYAASTSSYSKRDNLFGSEMKIIDLICKASKRAGLVLYIKPKPNGPHGDFDVFKEKYPHVEIGAYADTKTTTDYYLSNDLNLERKRETVACELVLNLGTTFFIDAALMGMPIVQLDIYGCLELGNMAMSHYNYHIQKYALGENAFKCRVAATFENDVYNALCNYKEKALAKSREVYQWITPVKSLPESVEYMAEEILM